MRTRDLAATLLILFAGAVLTASCVQSPSATPGADASTLTVEEEPGASAEDDVVSEAQEALKVIRCDDVDAVECMIRCAEAGIVCRPRLNHPNKSDAGKGDLYRCSDVLGRQFCAYAYQNGDTCIVASGTTWTPCIYTGGR